MPLSSAEITDLSNAYCNAPATFRRQLDNIDFFFISADACNPAGNPAACSGITGDQVVEGSWGARLKGGYTQIGLPAGLWPMGQAAGQYTDYESDILASLVPWAAAGNRLRFSPPTSNPGNTNATWMTVLAALAHEAGHVRWYEATVRSGQGARYDFKRLNDCNFFLGWQYNSPDTKLEPKGRWRYFAETAYTGNESRNDHQLAPGLSQFTSGAGNDDQTLDNLLAQLLAGNKPWASFLASDAPDEDFVETYKLSVLTDSGLTSLPMTIPTSTGSVSLDIPAYYIAGSNSYLTQKVQCIRRWL